MEEQVSGEDSDEKKEKEEKSEDAQSGLIDLREIEDEMKSSYLDYSMSVIVGRALPDVRDGLKPVHRRVLFAMNEMGMFHNKPFKKSARIVGEVLGKYHPHGDSAVYDSLVRMAQDFSLRYPLINGQGNFGSIDGDNAAAMRYTEARLNKIAEELLVDIDKETVPFVPNFDNSLEEPFVLPSKFPNLLVNGSSGIAVGMATNIPPHNLREVCKGIIRTIDNPDITFDELMEDIQGPDFPTGGLILGKNGIINAFATGKGRVKIKAKSHVEEKNNRTSIIVTEIPYMVNKALLIEQIADLVKNKVIDQIYDIRDESDRDGMRIVIELKHGAVTDIVTNQLLKHTRLQVSFGVIMLALVDNEPKVLNLKDMISLFIKHRKEIVVKRTQFDLRKAEERAHILEGLITALNDIDNVISTIKKSKDVSQAQAELVSNYSLTEIQAKAILEMKLSRLASLEQEKIKSEHSGLLVKIKDYKDILASELRVSTIIKDELNYLIENYGDARKTQILDVEDDDEIDMEDMIKPEDMVVTITHKGYVKRLEVDTYRQQGRGGKGIIGAGTTEEDFVEDIFVANTHDYILFFTNKGKVHWLKVYKIPQAGRTARGSAYVNLMNLDNDERVSAVIPVKDFSSGFLMFATKKGYVKKTDLNAFSRPRVGGIIALSIDTDDELIAVVRTDGQRQMMLATKKGKAARFKESDVRPMGRNARGVTGIRLKDDDAVVSLIVALDHKSAFTITENGYGKRTSFEDYRLIHRGGSGVINIITSDRNGNVVDVKSVYDDNDLIVISEKGIVIRVASTDISKIGRNTQGVRIMRLADGDRVVSCAKIKTVNGDIESSGDAEDLDEDSGTKESQPGVSAENEENEDTSDN